MATVILAPPPTKVALFPLAAIEAALRDELIEAVKMEASIRGITLPVKPEQIVKAAVQVDSLVVVTILCSIEPIIGFEIQDSVVRAGGYSSAESALNQLLPRLEKEWKYKNGVKP